MALHITAPPGQFADVNGVQLHYLDWGGEGEPLLFLAGLGDSAHIFTDIAPAFVPQFRVTALTRRGHGQSDRPDDGYDLPTLVEDIRHLLDHLRLQRVSLIGHSMAGDEMALFASRHPKRVHKLAFLDCTLSHWWLTDEDEDPLAVPPTPADFASADTMRDWLSRQCGFWSDAQEANLRATLVTLPDGSVRVGLPQRVATAITTNLLNSAVAPGSITPDALAFFAVVAEHPAVQSNDDPAVQAAANVYAQRWRAKQLAEIEHFKQLAPRSRIIQMPGAHHYLFIQHRDQVVREMQTFLAGDTTNRQSAIENRQS